MRENGEGVGEAGKTSRCSVGLTHVEEREGRKAGWKALGCITVLRKTGKMGSLQAKLPIRGVSDLPGMCRP